MVFLEKKRKGAGTFRIMDDARGAPTEVDVARDRDGTPTHDGKLFVDGMVMETP